MQNCASDTQGIESDTSRAADAARRLSATSKGQSWWNSTSGSACAFLEPSKALWVKILNQGPAGFYPEDLCLRLRDSLAQYRTLQVRLIQIIAQLNIDNMNIRLVLYVDFTAFGKIPRARHPVRRTQLHRF
jgi:hypothetical protein